MASQPSRSAGKCQLSDRPLLIVVFCFCFFLFLAIAHWTWQWMASWHSKLYFLHSFSTSWVEKVEVYGQTTSPALQISCVLHNDHCNNSSASETVLFPLYLFWDYYAQVKQLRFSVATSLIKRKPTYYTVKFYFMRNEQKVAISH